MLSRVAMGLRYQVGAGPSPSIRFPQGGPHDERRGFVGLPAFIDTLRADGYAVQAQARFSPRLLELTDWGLYTLYHEKTQAGLRLVDRDGKVLFAASYPERVYRSFDEIPALLTRTLLFIENRELLDARFPYKNPAVEWDRLANAVFNLGLKVVDRDRRVPGGSTLATQIEKFRHSPAGLTASIDDKFVQMASASLRAYLNVYNPVEFEGRPLEDVLRDVRSLGVKTGDGDEWVRIGALKTLIDGGILTGTAYLRQPWGPKAREIFGVVYPEYRGIPRMSADEFYVFARAGAEAGWKITAHVTGGAGVDLMLDAFERVNESAPVKPLRCSFIHGNFFDRQAIERSARLGIIADMQPAWFYKDADAMLYILGSERMKTFHPYRSLIDGGVVISAGSDHMVILDDVESINPYNPWLAIWTMVTHRTERGSLIDPEEAITREEALRCYTINNAFASFEEHLKGSIEPGKLADLVVTDKDYLNCSEDELKDMKVALTVVGGKVVYQE